MALITRKPMMYKMYSRAIQKATTAETIKTVFMSHLTLLIVVGQASFAQARRCSSRSTFLPPHLAIACAAVLEEGSSMAWSRSL